MSKNGTRTTLALGVIIAIPLALYLTPAETKARYLPAWLHAGSEKSAEAQGMGADGGGKQEAGAKADGKGEGKGGKKGGNRPPMVTTTEAKTGSLPVTMKTIGTIVPVASTGLASPTSGIVAEVLVTDGVTVKKDDLLVKLDDRTINANIARDTANLTKDQAALDNANATLKRTSTLKSTGTGTQQQYDDAVAAAKQAEAAIAVDTATLTADKVALTQTEIRAPFDGKLGVVQVSRGAYVSAGANIVTVTQMKPVFAEFTLPETDLAMTRAALNTNRLTVDIAPTLSRDANETISGPVVFIDNAVDAASGTFKLRARLDNADGVLWPGQALDVTVAAGEKDNLVLVPTVSVQPLMDGFICYVVGKDRTVQVRKVQVALNDGKTTGISDGLKQGELVVTEGQSGLADGAKVALADGHDAKQEPEKVATSAGAAP